IQEILGTSRKIVRRRRAPDSSAGSTAPATLRTIGRGQLKPAARAVSTAAAAAVPSIILATLPRIVTRRRKPVARAASAERPIGTRDSGQWERVARHKSGGPFRLNPKAFRWGSK